MKGIAGKTYDIAIVGGGLVGLALARLLAIGREQTGQRFRVAVLESRPPLEVPGADIDLRVSAIAPASASVLQTMGAWESLPSDRVSPYERMCVWQSAGSAGGPRSVSFDAAELGEANLGYIVENQAMRRAIWERLATDAAVDLITDRAFATAEIDAAACSVQLDDGSAINARLVVGADGARSTLRHQLEVDYRETAHQQAAVVGHIATEIPHAATAWQRFLAGGPVALLPLSDGRSSLVWSCPEQLAASLLRLDDNEFAQRLEAALDSALGNVRVTTPRVSFPLASGYAVRYCGPRFALIGDAAHRVHPLAGQGVNLGLLDAAVLAETLVAHLQRPGADPGDARVLRSYERSRKGDNLLTLGAMVALNGLFTGPGRELGGRGLELVSGFPAIKNQFARYAMGHGRDLPAAARSEL